MKYIVLIKVYLPERRVNMFCEKCLLLITVALITEYVTSQLVPTVLNIMPNILLFTINVKIPILFSPVACKTMIKGTHASGVGPY